MAKYKVYFELYGKKMCSTVEANSSANAEKAIKDKIIFHKTQPVQVNSDSELDNAFEAIKKALNL